MNCFLLGCPPKENQTTLRLSSYIYLSASIISLTVLCPFGASAQTDQPLKPPSRVSSNQLCISCHLKVTPGVIREYMAGTKWRRLRQSCESCHGSDHDKIIKSGGMVPDEVCARCHTPVYREHTEGGHTYRPDAFIQDINWERNIRSPHYSQFSPDVRRISCDPCHSIAGATLEKYRDVEQGRFTDTSILINRSGCGKCHTAHGFSVDEARRPEACMTCHTGEEDSSAESYSASHHGNIYAAEGGKWDWSLPLKQARYGAPTCAFCHMRIVDEKGVVVTHNMSRKIIWGMGLDTPSSMDRSQQGKRKEMLRICNECHSPRFSREYLESADKVRIIAAQLVKEARGILEGLYKDKILEIRKRSLSPGLSGTPHSFTASEKFGVYWPMGLFYDTSRIERTYFDLAVFYAPTGFKGAFHASPAHSWWKGLLPAYERLNDIKTEAQSLRAFVKMRRYALIGIGLGGAALILLFLVPRRGRRKPSIEI